MAVRSNRQPKGMPNVVSRPQDQIIEANGLKFHCREWGDARSRHALVLLVRT